MSAAPQAKILNTDDRFSRHRCTAGTDDEVGARAYLDRLDQHLVESLADPAATLGSVSSQARGAFPSLVAERLRALGRAGVLARPESPRAGAAPPPGPEQHPVDFEWYFEPDTASTLADELRPATGETLLLGAPTVAAQLRQRGAQALLVDRSPFLADRFGPQLGSACPHDLGRPLGHLRTHRVVFFDAPWHEDHINRWLWQASLAVQRGGRIAFAMFGELTRPAAKDERDRILERAASIGNVSVVADALQYWTPPFESEALAAAGTPLAVSWRRGDLVVIDAQRTSAAPVPPAPLEEGWTTWTVGDEVVKVRRARQSPGPAAGDGPESWVLGTVSRRRSRRAQIEMWTSRNVVSRAIDYHTTVGWLAAAGQRATGFEHSRAEFPSLASPR